MISGRTMMIRACPVLDNRRGRERPCYVTGFQARRLTVFSSFLSFADSREKNFKCHFV